MMWNGPLTSRKFGIRTIPPLRTTVPWTPPPPPPTIPARQLALQDNSHPRTATPVNSTSPRTTVPGKGWSGLGLGLEWSRGNFPGRGPIVGRIVLDGAGNCPRIRKFEDTEKFRPTSACADCPG